MAAAQGPSGARTDSSACANTSSNGTVVLGSETVQGTPLNARIDGYGTLASGATGSTFRHKRVGERVILEIMHEEFDGTVTEHATQILMTVVLDDQV